MTVRVADSGGCSEHRKAFPCMTCVSEAQCAEILAKHPLDWAYIEISRAQILAVPTGLWNTVGSGYGPYPTNVADFAKKAKARAKCSARTYKFQGRTKTRHHGSNLPPTTTSCDKKPLTRKEM